MTTVIIEAFNGKQLKDAIDALGATNIHVVTKIKNAEFLVVYS